MGLVSVREDEMENKANGTEEPSALETPNGSTGEIEHGSRNKRFSLVDLTGFTGHGDSYLDAWLLATAAQVGQVVLTLPYTLAQMGIVYGLLFLTSFGLLGAWGVYLLCWLYFEYKGKLTRLQKALPKGHIVQYHEVIAGVAGRWAGYITFFFIIGSLFLAGVIQVVASSSNLYYISDSLDKRQWTFIAGSVSMLSIFLPHFGHMRGLSFIGMITTTITSIYLLIAALSHGQLEGVRHTGPKDNLQFFTGVTNTIFTFGGHGVTVEILEAMRKPSKFSWIYLSVVCYTLTFMVPSGVSVYWAYGDILLHRANAFSVVPKSGWRTMAIVLMILHQVVAYCVFVLPVFHVVEKAAGVHTRPGIFKILVRVPIVLGIWFVAIAIPFFGLINAVMGALIVTVGAYTIPPAVFFITYRTAAARQSSVKQPPLLVARSWKLLFLVNGIIVLWTLTIGLGFGGWASVSNVVKQIKTVGFFDKCYQCPPKK